jgi:LysM repeat protein
MFSKTLLVFSFCSLSALSIMAQTSQAHFDYIERFKEIAIIEMERTGIPASIKLAQGILESNAGRSFLAEKANNHFGIKCGSTWTGKKVYRKDDDYNDRGELIESCFRGYKNADASYIAHSEFLRDPRKQFRYGFLFDIPPTDYKRWARGLKDAGYATSMTYPNKLIDIIQRYELYRYDQMTSPEVIADVDVIDEGEGTVEIPGSVFKNNDVRYALALEGETPTDISIRTGVKLSALLAYNENKIDRNQKLKAGTVIYVQSKRNSYRGKRKWHYVQNDESMFYISQLYGIHLDRLYERNRFSPPAQPAVGERVKIRGGKIDSPPKLARDIPTPPEKEEEEVDLKEDLFEEEEEEVKPVAPEDKEPLIPLPDFEEDDKDKEDELLPPITPDPNPRPIEEKEEPKEEQEVDMEEDIFEEEKEETPAPQPPAEVYHTVVKGDTLYNISRRYNTTVDALKRLNNLNSNIINLGQRLRVK